LVHGFTFLIYSFDSVLFKAKILIIYYLCKFFSVYLQYFDKNLVINFAKKLTGKKQINIF